MLIYKITNKINGKSYIGKTKRSLEERIGEHIKAAERNKKYVISRAIRKYGIDNFDISILDDSAITNNDLSLLEQKYIAKYDTYKCGYNMTPGGEGGNTLSSHPNKKEIYEKCVSSRKYKQKEINEKISTSNSGENNYIHKMSEAEYKEFIEKYRMGENNPMHGYIWSDEQRAAKSEKMSGENNPFYNKQHTEETKLKMRENSKGKNSGETNCNYGKTGAKNHCSKEYIITTPGGVEIYIKGMREFCKEYGLIEQCLGSVARGITKHHKQYKCRYYDEEVDYKIKEISNYVCKD